MVTERVITEWNIVLQKKVETTEALQKFLFGSVISVWFCNIDITEKIVTEWDLLNYRKGQKRQKHYRNFCLVL